jgi:diguanylate cyclase (GGDEF)-like protein
MAQPHGLEIFLHWFGRDSDNADMGSEREPREIGGATTGALIVYVRRVGGEGAVQAVLDRAGEPRSPEELTDTTTWSSYAQASALFRAAEEVIGDADVALHAGEELLLQYADTEVAALLRSLGSPTEVLRNIAATAAKYSTVTDMEALEVGDGSVVVSARTTGGIQREAHFCRYTAGVLSQATPLFGLPRAVVVETECQTRGDERCLYSVSWDVETAPDEDLQRRCDHLDAELRSLTTRFEALQEAGTELMTATSVDEVLECVSRRAALAVRAPQHLLAVRVAADGPLRVHHDGFATHEDAIAAAQELLDAEMADDVSGSRLVVDVATVRRRFGSLAAFYPEGVQFFPQERRLLAAYAGHVAAALEAAAALEEARRENATAHVLLGLGRALADLGTRDEVAERLASATASVVDADVISVLLWDDERAVLELVASVGMTEDAQRALEGLAISAADTPVLARIMQDSEPQLLTSDPADEFVAGLFGAVGMGSAAVVPITRGGRFFGVVTAAFKAADVDADGDLVSRLAGMADHAATALQNSTLLEQVQHQALHDPLTSLPNARLLEDRVNVALAGAARDRHALALLFLDLDHFKPVNDTYGHAAGDAVLVEVGHRLQLALRAGDTVARLAGDEFVILLPRVSDRDDAERVARKLNSVLERPFYTNGDEIHIAASSGLAVFPEGGCDYRTLLREADIAMYRAKAENRSRLVSNSSG